MKKKLLFISLTFFVIAFSATAQNGWYPQKSCVNNIHTSIFFLDNNNGWAVNQVGDIIHTTDGGNNWSKISYIYTMLRDIKFSDFNNGWAASIDGFAYKTTDGGFSWIEPSLQDSTSSPESIFFIDSLRGWSAGYGGYNTYDPNYFTGEIDFTSDGGVSWIKQYEGSYHLIDIHFIDSSYGWAVGRKGTILYTSDGGLNWIRQDSLLTNIDLNSVFFIDSLNGWAVGGEWYEGGRGGHGIIIHTSNGGQNWSIQTAAKDTTLSDVTFANAFKGWAVGIDGTILSTSNGGNDWSLQSSGVNFDLVSVSFVDSTSGWISGSADTILHTTDGGMTFIREDKKSESLARCSPNPFTDNSTIEYTIKEPSQVRLSIFDNFGREIEILVNEFQDIGEYKKIVEAKGLSSGAYYLRLNIRGIAVTEKMIIIR